ncbi:hypothetical protein F9B74_04595 [Pelistega sp. NLN82]|uniref:Transmembrane protein n=1 Tax=Pelistega ratti TaxID=2652177 RepID=A0A6L9Y6V1_9BURK|nr:hypothetical protein [Pelistega ratti]NEN75607.1 hypothetical protein [Pelistega ratti]
MENEVVVIDDNKSLEPHKTMMYATYILYALGIFTGILSIVGLIIAYIKRDEVRGTIYALHYTWLIRTFWIGILFFCVAWVLAFVSFGLLGILFFVPYIWYVFRVVYGFVKCIDAKPVNAESYFA